MRRSYFRRIYTSAILISALYIDFAFADYNLSQEIPTTIVIGLAPSLTASIIDFGEIEPNHQQTSIESFDSHNGALFVMDANDAPSFKKDNIKDELKINPGTNFGILVQIDSPDFDDLSIAPIRTRWSHPKFDDGIEVEEWASPMNIGLARYAGWVVEDGEMHAGIWTVEILYKDKVLASKSFKISLDKEN